LSEKGDSDLSKEREKKRGWSVVLREGVDLFISFKEGGGSSPKEVRRGILYKGRAESHPGTKGRALILNAPGGEKRGFAQGKNSTKSGKKGALGVREACSRALS